jgi:UDP-glucose 4-epimerase
MKVLVTGGAGFIGANLCRALLDDGHEVRAFDNLSTGRVSNLAGLPVELVQGDIRERDQLRRAAADVQSIVHLAARGSVPRSVEDPDGAHDVNVNGTLNVLAAAREQDAHLVFSSSSSVYGANPELPKRESMRPEPMSPYAASKLAGEAYVTSFARVYNMDALVFRLFNVYGPLQPAGHDYAAVIPAFIDAILGARPVTVYGDGRQSRDFTSVDSVVEVVARAVKHRTTATSPVNLAFSTSTSLLELLDALRNLTGRNVEVCIRDPRMGDIVASQADPAALLDLFPGIQPVPLDVGLRRTVAWFQSELAR